MAGHPCLTNQQHNIMCSRHSMPSQAWARGPGKKGKKALRHHVNAAAAHVVYIVYASICNISQFQIAQAAEQGCRDHHKSGTRLQRAGDNAGILLTVLCIGVSEYIATESHTTRSSDGPCLETRCQVSWDRGRA